jgi:hypothetical protein
VYISNKLSDNLNKDILGYLIYWFVNYVFVYFIKTNTIFHWESFFKRNI